MASSETLFLSLKVRHLLFWAIFIPIAIGFVFGIIAAIVGFDVNDPLFVPFFYILASGLLSLWVFQRLHQLDVPEHLIVGHLRPNYPWLPTIGIVITILLFSLGSGQLFYYVLSQYYPTLVESLLSQKVFLSSEETIAPFWHNSLNLIALIVVAPVVEELIFRGIIFQRWATKWGIAPALVVSSLLFGILHANFIGLFVFGLMMALLYVKTRTLIVPIACHALNNLAAVGLDYVSRRSDPAETVEVLAQLDAYWWVGLIYIAISLPWLMLFIAKNWPEEESSLPYIVNANALRE
jgi:hypothetical protein